MEEWEVYPQVAATVGDMAVREGHARKNLSRDELLCTCTDMIQHTRKTMEVLRNCGIILEPPE